MRPYKTPKPGDRVTCAADPDRQHGTVERVVRQRFTDDLVQVEWDIDKDDRDLYSMAVIDPSEVKA